MKRHRQLEFLVFKLGGVAGAVRRLIYKWKGLFSSSLIREALARKYPMLEPAPYQIHDILDWMERRNRIQCAICNAWEKLYKLAPYQLTLKFT